MHWYILFSGFLTVILVQLMNPGMENWRRSLSSLLACTLVALILASIHWHHEQLVLETLIKVYGAEAGRLGEIDPPAE